MRKTTLFFIAFLFSFSCFSQSIKDLYFFPIYDSMGGATYIKKSQVKEYNSPKKDTKIERYNEQLEIIGYWEGSKKKYVNLQPKRKPQKLRF
jgi:hypothetical protein